MEDTITIPRSRYDRLIKVELMFDLLRQFVNNHCPDGAEDYPLPFVANFLEDEEGEDT